MKRYAVVGAVLLLVAAWVWFRPFLGTPRTTTASTPSTLTERSVPLRVAPGSRLCLNRVAFDARTRQALVKVMTRGGPPQPLVVTAPQTRTILRRYSDGGEVGAQLTPPARSRLGTICFENSGRRPVWMAGSDDPRRQFRGTTTIDDDAPPAELSLELFERRPERLRSRPAEILDWMALWRPALFAEPVLWVLLVLVVAGVPVGVLWAFASSVRDEEEPAAEGPPPPRPPPEIV